MNLNKTEINLFSRAKNNVSLTYVLDKTMAPHSAFTQSHSYLRDFNQLVIHITFYRILMTVYHK